jgi:chromosome segregation ATPase
LEILSKFSFDKWTILSNDNFIPSLDQGRSVQISLSMRSRVGLLQVDLASSVDVQERLGKTSTKLATLRQDLARVEDLQASHAKEQEKRAEERSKALKRAQACDEEMKDCEKAAEKLKKQKEQMEKKQQALEEEIASLADGYEVG